MYKDDIRVKIRQCLSAIMILGIVLCVLSVVEKMMVGTVLEKKESVLLQNEKSPVIWSGKTKQPSFVAKTEELPELPAETEVLEQYTTKVRLYYVEKPQKRTRAKAIEKIEELSLQFPELSFVLEKEALYPDGVLTAVANNPEMTDFACGYPDSDGSVTGGFTQEEMEQEYPLFLQFDPRWGYYPYGKTVMGDAGCGPTCLSMAIFYLTRDASVTPDVIAQYSMDNKYYVSNVGTAWSLLDEYPAQHGLSSTVIPVIEDTMKQKLEEGNILICSMRPGNFTAGGHFVVLYGTNEG